MGFLSKTIATKVTMFICSLAVMGLIVSYYITKDQNILIYVGIAILLTVCSVLLNVWALNRHLSTKQDMIQLQKEFGALDNTFPNIVYKGTYKEGEIILSYTEGILPEMYNMTTDSIRNRNIRDVLPSEICDQVLTQLNADTGITSFDFMITFKGKHYHNRMKLQEGEILGYATDITELQKAKDKIKHISHYDSLTELPNRVMLDKKLAKLFSPTSELEEGTHLALLVLDLDNFKTINDTKGYAVGDKLLRHVAELLKKHIGPDDILARIGSDEFALMLPDMKNVEDVEKLAQNIIHDVSLPFTIGDSNFEITVCIGISIFPTDCYDAKTLFKNADMAMSAAKSRGQNIYQFFTADIYIQKLRKLEIQDALKNAIKNNEFKVYYQPQINIHSGLLVGTEALVRWIHPQKGMISPGEFIPLAEETGLILQIGEWVLRTACQQQIDWVRQGYDPIKMSVNLSALQFGQKDLVSIIAKVLEETNMDPKYLNLEITETTSMSDINVTITVLNELREMGIAIAIDDFGTGYSSLNYLTQFPINTLKIDRSFINDIMTKNGEMVTKSIIILANGLNLNVVAEGVETSEQLDLLKTLQCHEVQGFLFSPALPKDKFEQFLVKS